jgi:hypothetical protein
MPRRHRDEHPEPEELTFRSDAIEQYGHHLTPMSAVRSKPPDWIIPGLLVEGFNFYTGDPKTYKSTLTFCMIAATLNGLPIGGEPRRKAKKRGPVVVMAPEQSPGEIKHIYEQRIIKKPWPKSPVSWDFAFVEEPLKWKLDRERGSLAYDPTFDLVNFIKVWRPYILILDPLNLFHSMDENDPAIAQILVGPKEAMKKIGGALVVVHHNRKSKGDGSDKAGDFSRARGSSALWALADGGVQLNMAQVKKGTGTQVQVSSNFKMHPPEQWTWTVPR